jgi:hypothetical protein
MLHLTTYSSFINHDRPLISITNTIVWQNILLSYSLMSCTIPTLKGFLKGLTTGGVGYTEDISGVRSSGNNNSNSYQLRSLPKANTKATLMPEGYTECEARVTSVQRSGGEQGSADEAAPRERSRSNLGDGGSVVSFDSQRIMLKREWAVSRE